MKECIERAKDQTDLRFLRQTVIELRADLEKAQIKMIKNRNRFCNAITKIAIIAGMKEKDAYALDAVIRNIKTKLEKAQADL